MTSPLDEISYKLGEVSAGLAVLAQQNRDASTRMDAVQDSVQALQLHLEPLANDVKWMKPQVQSYRQVRKHALWVGGVFIAVLSAAGGQISDWVFRRYIG